MSCMSCSLNHSRLLRKADPDDRSRIMFPHLSPLSALNILLTYPMSHNIRLHNSHVMNPTIRCACETPVRLRQVALCSGVIICSACGKPAALDRAEKAPIEPGDLADR